MRNTVSSIKAKEGQCLILWSESKCRGLYARIESENRYWSDLSKLHFDFSKHNQDNIVSVEDNTQSISKCPDAVQDKSKGWKYK